MCETGPVTKIAVVGSGKGPIGWFALDHAQVYHDHPFNAQLDHAVIVDLLNKEKGALARICLELSHDSALELAHALLEVAGEVEAREAAAAAQR